MRKLMMVALILTFVAQAFGQKVKLYGIVTDEKDSAMIGVNVVVKNTSNGTVTDSAGKYELEVDPGIHSIDFSYIGYSPRSVIVSILEGKDKQLNTRLAEEGKELDIVVVTGTKYEKKLGEEVVSMEVLKTNVINQNNAKMDEAMNKVPGINMLGKTISIRGGSGFADATGNRVLALLDEMPIISPENGGIIWNMVPIEELEQVEVIKGSSSALYGSSALNGVINMRTINPKPEMENKVLLYYGFYDQPKNKDWSWWWKRTIQKKNGKTFTRIDNPMFGGGQFTHSKQYGDFGVVFSGAYSQDQGFRSENDFKRVRMSAKLRYIPHKLQRLTVGLNMNFYHENLKDFFAAKGYDSLIYLGVSTPPISRQRSFNIDPYINFYDKQENRHSLKFRIFNNLYNSNSGDSTESTQMYFDYTFLKNFKKINLIITTGVNGFYTLVRGKTFANVIANINAVPYYNTRDLMNFAGFIQVEKKFFKRLTLSGGLRLEFAQLAGETVENKLPLINLINKSMGHKNDINSPVTPVARIGFNYQATEGTFIRGSFGQGFRYPALSEKYVYTVRSGAQVFPNDSLKPENGWSAEIGIKQGVKISKWMAYFDLSGFVMRYHDMIEFTAVDVLSLPDSVLLNLQGIPFKAHNVDNARIMGVEFSAIANGTIFGVPLNFLVGYTYIDPRNLSYDPSDPNSTKILKYRIQHTAKADIQTNYKGFTVGVSAFYNSFMKNIDNATLGFLPVVGSFRKAHDKGDFVMDVRAGFNYKDKFTFMFICKNVINTEYWLRPALVEAPRNYTFQVGYNF